MAATPVNNTAGRESTGVTSHSIAFDPGTCDALYIGVYHDDDVNNTFSSVQFNGVAMTLVAEAPAGNERLHIWRVLSPASGSHNFTCTTDGTNRLLYAMVSLLGVDQTTPNGTPVTVSASTGVPRSTGSVTCPTDGLVLGMYREQYSGSVATATAGTLLSQFLDGNGRQVGSAYRTDTGAITFSSENAAFPWDAIGIPINAAASGTLDQEGFRFGLDDGSESSHTWAAAQDANVTAPLAQNLLVRALVDATGDPASTAYTLRYQKNGSGGYVTVPVGANSSPAVSYGAIGTIGYSASGGTSVDAAYPSGITSRSGLVLIVGQKPSSANGGTVTTPSGWTLQGSLTGANDGDTGGYTTTLGADTGNCNLFVYTKNTVTGSESGNLTVTVGTNGVCWGVIVRLQSSDDCTWSWACGVGKDTSAGNVSIATGSLAIASGDHVLMGMVIPTDVTTPSQFSAEALSQSGTTFGTVTEIGEPDSTTGNDIGGFLAEAPVSSGSGSGAATLTATAGGTTTNVRGPGFVLRARVAAVAREVYVATSSNIAGGGEATTARLTAPSGKSTSDFVTGRRWDDENGTDSIDITADDYTEVEWCIQAQAPAAAGDYFDFRVYSGSSALTSYTATARWTIGTTSTPSLPPMQNLFARMPALRMR